MLPNGCAASFINCGNISITILNTAASPYSLKASAIFCLASASAAPRAKIASACAWPVKRVLLASASANASTLKRSASASATSRAF